MKYIIAAIVTAICGVFVAGALPQTAYAVDTLEASCKVDPTAPICQSRGDELFGPNSFWTRLINIMIYVIGTISVLMVVIGGLRYTMSGGDSGQTKSAKDTILYAIIGVVIAIMSYAILNFVVVELVK